VYKNRIKFFFIIFLFFSNFAYADQNDSRLDNLFDELFHSSNNVKTNIILADIWNIWYMADNEETQLIFDEANQFMDRGEFKNAINLFTKTIDQSPDFAEAWNKRATVYFLKGELEKSIADIKKTLELEPRHFGALDGLAEIYLIKDDLLSAAAIYKRILKIIPFSKKSLDRLKHINDSIV
tara:strand:+ start:457 stop:999 length:543 start_codon:yes stop_codon:yes gene_type:complete